MARRRIYFVSDLHASERCWRKFLAAPRFYEADIVIVGGDITGKFVVPIIAGPNGKWTVENFLGRKWRVSTRDDLAKLKAQIADTGHISGILSREFPPAPGGMPTTPASTASSKAAPNAR